LHFVENLCPNYKSEIVKENGLVKQFFGASNSQAITLLIGLKGLVG
jgi:hypothetical protein